MSNIVEYDANEHELEAVTVFQMNRAEVNRRIQATLKDGQNRVEIKNLPTCLDRDSIRVDGIGNAVIFDVIYHARPPLDKSKQAEAFKDLQERRSTLKAELHVLKNQSEFLMKYGRSLTGDNSTVEKMENFLKTYANEQKKIDCARMSIDEEIQLVEDKIKEVYVNINFDEENFKKRGVNITIVVLGKGDGEAELSLTYSVSNAWWTPQYDLRAFVAHDAKSDSTVNLHYQASIMQSTGEDWSNVHLVLSTASPLQGTSIPTLVPNWIGELAKPTHMRHSPSPIYSRRSRSRSPTRAIVIHQARSSRSRSWSRGRHGREQSMEYLRAQIEEEGDAQPPPGFFAGRDSVAAEGTVSTTFTIPGLSSIPSNSLKNSQTHKVSISEIRMSSVVLEWITVPKEVPSVFLQCKVRNTSQYVLLPGQASVFMNNNFVAKSSVPFVSPQESFSCSLGIDPAVRITYHPQSKKIKTNGTVISGKSTSTKFEQRITAKNTRLTPISRLILKDQVPVSSNARINVNVLIPRELQLKTTKQVQVQKGVVAQWAPPNVGDFGVDSDDMRGASNLGFIEWICEMDAGASIDITLAWEINVPPGLVWANQ